MKVAAILLLPTFAFAHPGHGTAPGDSHAYPVRTGHGPWTYQSIPNWGDLLTRKNIGPTHGGVVVDNKSGFIYFSTSAEHGILVYKPDGILVKSIAPECRGLHAMDIAEENGMTFIFGAQLAGPKPLRVVKLDTEGKVSLEISEKTIGPIKGGWEGLTGVAVAPDGSIFCSMGYGSNFIHKFDASGKLLKSFGGPGDGKKVATNNCHGLKIDLRYGEPRLLICDRENRRLIHADLDGNWIGEYASNLRRPCAVSILGHHCAVAELEARVTILDRNGKPVAFLGENPNKAQWANFSVPPAEMKPGIFAAPHGLSFDKKGNLYVQDWNKTGRITMLWKLR